MKPAIIVDRDGTLARIDRRMVEGDDPNWADFHAAIPFDTPVPAVVALTQLISEHITVIIMTGRGEERRREMLAWLYKHHVRYDLLLMRPRNDTRRDDKVKRDLYLQCVKPYYDVRLVVDDRPEVCDTWRELGLPLIQVTQPEELPPFQYLTGGG